jgi:ABC-type antimicrobial peptide transport system permease subunit
MAGSSKVLVKMLPRDIIESAWQCLGAHRLRSGLSILGIIIGIASFSIMYSVGESARQKSITALQALGGDIIRVTPNIAANPEAALLPGSPKGANVTLQDVLRIKEFCSGIMEVSPEIAGQAEVFRGGKKKNLSVLGIFPSYEDMFKLKVSRGRLMSEVDLEAGNQVCLMGAELANQIFPNRNPLKQQVAIKGYLFKIIGIIQDTGQADMGNSRNNILIPFPLAQRILDSKDIRGINIRVRDTEAAISQLHRFFHRRFGEDAQFDIRSRKQLLQAQEKQVKIFEYILWTIGSISLLVGGIGIMNIMLVSVTERVREIGIRRALGATKRDIQLQFLCESVMLCFVGGLGGAALGVLGAKLISYMLQFPPVFSVKLLILALGIASILGIICGTYPAARAAEQDPTVVLRYE